jgi:hypothetical protein
MTTSHDTVEQLVRARMAAALGGRRGVLEGAVPTALFTVLFVTTHELKMSLIVSVVVTAVLLVVRVVQRQPVQFVLNALVGVGIGALFASRAGGSDEAKAVAYFLPGIIYNAVYAVAFIVSIIIGWPLVGFLVGSVTGDPTEWHKDRGLVRLCSLLTAVMAVPCIVRVLVQYPLYLSGHAGWLGTSKLALGWPLQLASFAVMIWLLSRNRTPLEPDLA